MKKVNTDIFIEKANKIHNERYDYSLVNYKKSIERIKIICKKHGIFEQTPNVHLGGSGCLLCGKEKNDNDKRHTLEYFIEKANKIHNNKYDYTLVIYKNCETKVKIICPEHGIFEQIPYHHLRGVECSLCKKVKLTQDIFINESKIIHGNKYDYSLVEYINTKTKVKIICPIHGKFEQKPSNHLRGRGCKICNDSKGEIEIKKILDRYNIKYEKQFKFKDCKNIFPLPFDFYLPKYNICIEYDGEQHYESIKYWGGDETFEKIKLRDSIKNEYCKNNNIKLIRIKYDENISEKLEEIL
jgi:very-short-patch-repair endonuclease